MKEIINFLKNSWTLRTVGLMTLIFTIMQFVLEYKFEVSSIIIYFFVALYFVWGFGKPPKKSQQ